MIGRLKGIIDELGDQWVLVDVNGVGYLVICSSRTLARLAIGEVAVLEIETHVREDHIHLYGFADSSERDWFKLLTTVQGVGAKVGLAILSTVEPEELMQALASADSGVVSRSPGVGPKLAKRIVSELKDKVGSMAAEALVKGVGLEVSGAIVNSVSSNAIAEATSALVNLGYGPSEAMTAISRVSVELGDEVGVESLIRDGLRELAPINKLTEG